MLFLLELIIKTFIWVCNWDKSKVTDMQDVFYDATVFNRGLCNWNVTNVTDFLDFVVNYWTLAKPNFTYCTL